MDASDIGTLRVGGVTYDVVVSRAKPPKPPRRKYKVGDTLSGVELRETMWKRGTVITDGGSVAFLLNAEGMWQDSEGGNDPLSFGNLDAGYDWQYTIARLP